jgi:hypothetical protein
MPQAAVRAQLPQTLSLTPEEIAALSIGGMHLVTLREEENFTPRRTPKALPATSRITVGAVTVRCTPTGARLHYRYTGMIGAPDRSHRPPIEFDVAAGRRARIAYNGRFSGYGIEWLYKLLVITIAVGIAPSINLFIGIADHTIEDLADLF